MTEDVRAENPPEHFKDVVASPESVDPIKHNYGRKKAQEAQKRSDDFLSSGRPPRLPDRRIGKLDQQARREHRPQFPWTAVKRTTFTPMRAD
jgi:hypothetical protein